LNEGLNRIEREIIRVILQEKTPMTINEISKKSGISWVTVKKYIPILKNKGVLDEIKKNE
jgi:response regulator of citrate/malate metabolism